MNYVPRLAAVIFVSSLISCVSAATAGQKHSKAQLPSVQIPLVELKMDKAALVAEIAKTQEQHTKGLSGRRSFPDNGGMLFIFDKPERVCMWMKDTWLPLSVAYIDTQGKIVQLTDMQANTETSHCAEKDVLYTLEAHVGWFDENGVTVGTQVRGLPSTKEKRNTKVKRKKNAGE